MCFILLLRLIYWLLYGNKCNLVKIIILSVVEIDCTIASDIELGFWNDCNEGSRITALILDLLNFDLIFGAK